MCDPITIASIAATVGGNYIQGQQNNASIQSQYNAKKAAMLQGLEVQKQHQADAAKVLDPTIAGFTPPAQQADLGALIAKRSDTINNNVTPATGNTDIQSAPKVIQSDLADKMGKTAAFGLQQGTALGRMGATNDQFLNNSLNINNAQNKIGTIDNFARADAGVNQAQQEEAYNNARKGPSMFGNLLSTAGTLGGLYGFSGGTASGLSNSVGSGVEGVARKFSSAPPGPINLPLWGNG